MFPLPSASAPALLRLGVISSLGFTAAAASVFMLITAPHGTQVWGLAGAGLFGAALTGCVGASGTPASR